MGVTVGLWLASGGAVARRHDGRLLGYWVTFSPNRFSPAHSLRYSRQRCLKLLVSLVSGRGNELDNQEAAIHL
jgi:hypothetical protein